MLPVIVIGIVGVALFLIWSGGGMKLQPNTIAGYATQAGFSGNDLVTAVAVALAESGGDSKAYNPEVAAGAPIGKGSYGLWQIYLHAHPEFANDDLYDPQVNADDAYEIYAKAGNSFQPWSTFKNGAYQAHLTVAQSSISV